MKGIMDIFGYIWHKTKSIYNVYTMLLGIGAGMFCYFVDGSNYGKKGLSRERRIARITGVSLFIFAAVLYILIKVF